MRKIRNDVDLKKLEKFGFKNTVNDTWYKIEKNDDYERFKTNIVVNPIGDFEKDEVIVEICDDDNSEGKCDIDIGMRVDTLYDLIQAGLIVKE